MTEQPLLLNAPDDPILGALVKDQVTLTAKYSAIVLAMAATCYMFVSVEIAAISFLYLAKWWSELYALRNRIVRGRFGDNEDDFSRLNGFLRVHGGTRVHGTNIQ